jgi:hypothetical protein
LPTRILASVLALLIRPGVACADDAVRLAYDGLCSRITNYINTIVDYTTTRCESAIGTKDVALMLFVKEPVFSDPKARLAWGLVAITAAGKVTRDSPRPKVDIIALADSDLVARHKAVLVPVTVAQKIQIGVHDKGLVSDAEVAVDALLDRLTDLPSR